MICLKNLSDEHLEKIASVFAEAFLREEGTLKQALYYEQAVRYFKLTLDEYMRIGRLFAISDNEEGYIVWHRKNEGLKWYREFILFFRYLKYMETESMQRMILVRHGWKDYTVKYADRRSYINVALLCIKTEEQGKGLLRKLLQDPFKAADSESVPCILDTDSELKAAKYSACGMKISDDAVLESGVHMYTMIYIPDKKH